MSLLQSLARLLPDDAFAACVAFEPVAVYLLLLGMLSLARRPFLVSGGRDAAVLGLALSGLLIIGPIALFFPDAMAARFGSYAWIPMLVVYCMGMVLVLLMLRPRLIIYNASADQLRPILADLVERLDRDARWAGDSLVLPGLGVQLHVDGAPLWRNVSLVAVGRRQNYVGWRRLELALRAALRRVEVARGYRGLVLALPAVLIIAWLAAAIAQDPQTVAQKLLDVLQLNGQ
jgi:hypothetical protein